jgi:hypothetical protein
LCEIYKNYNQCKDKKAIKRLSGVNSGNMCENEEIFVMEQKQTKNLETPEKTGKNPIVG